MHPRLHQDRDLRGTRLARTLRAQRAQHGLALGRVGSAAQGLHLSADIGDDVPKAGLRPEGPAGGDAGIHSLVGRRGIMMRFEEARRRAAEEAFRANMRAAAAAQHAARHAEATQNAYRPPQPPSPFWTPETVDAVQVGPNRYEVR